MGLFDADGEEYHEGIVRTPEDCTNCSKQFVAKLNYDKDGEHRIVCPHCGHEHFRVIKKGVMTSERWGSHGQKCIEVSVERMWSDKTEGIETHSAHSHIRSRFLDLARKREREDSR